MSTTGWCRQRRCRSRRRLFWPPPRHWGLRDGNSCPRQACLEEWTSRSRCGSSASGRSLAVPYRVGPFSAARDPYQLQQGARTVAVTPKLLDVLFHLLERPATLVTKEELLDAVWPDANVTDNA